MTGYRVVTVRSMLKPRWWQLRRRYYAWRMMCDVAKLRQRYTPEVLQMVDDLEKKIERKFLFGDE